MHFFSSRLFVKEQSHIHKSSENLSSAIVAWIKQSTIIDRQDSLYDTTTAIKHLRLLGKKRQHLKCCLIKC